MCRFLLLCWMILQGTATLMGQTYPVDVLQNAGPASNRVNLLILGDGYRSADQAKLSTDANNLLTSLWKTPPFDQYRQCFNVKLVHVVSTDQGADNGSYGATRNTALDAGYSPSMDRLLTVSTTKAIRIAQTHASEYSYIIVIVNDPKYGGSGGEVCVLSTHTSAVEVFLHELGHTFGGLADEYTTPYPGYPSCGSECPEPNVTPKTAREQIKWKAWIKTTTPVPTPTTYTSDVGLFEGARYQVSGLYRPKYACRMRALGSPFCEVCREGLVWSVYDTIEPIDGASPASPVQTQPGTSIPFSVTCPTLNPASFQVTWRLDGQVVATSGTTYTLTTTGLSSGTHTLVADIKDQTVYVRSDPNALLTGRATWTVNVEGTPAPLTIQTQPKSVTVAAGQPASMTVTAAGGVTPYHYRWFKGTQVVGTDADRLAWTSIQAADAGTYSVEVSDSSPTPKKVTSAVATLTVSTPADRIVNGSFESGASSWSGTTTVIGNWSSYNEPAYEGIKCAYLGGQGKTATENLYQTVTLPGALNGASLSFYLHIDTAETEAKVYDTLKVQVLNSAGSVLATLATYSNVNAASGYALKTFDLRAYQGQTVRIAFVMNEDASLQTSFLVDKVSLTTR